jgi:hypothetical protein
MWSIVRPSADAPPFCGPRKRSAQDGSARMLCMTMRETASKRYAERTSREKRAGQLTTVYTGQGSWSRLSDERRAGQAKKESLPVGQSSPQVGKELFVPSDPLTSFRVHSVPSARSNCRKIGSKAAPSSARQINGSVVLLKSALSRNDRSRHALSFTNWPQIVSTSKLRLRSSSMDTAGPVLPPHDMDAHVPVTMTVKLQLKPLPRARCMHPKPRTNLTRFPISDEPLAQG